MLQRSSLILIVALFAVACDETPTQPNASDTQIVEVRFDAHPGNPVVRRLTVGGADGQVFGPPGSDANFSLVALQRADGTVTGQWSDQYGGAGMHAEIDCLYVDGNTAWVSGPITKHTDASLVGRTANSQVRDGGDAGDDMISPVFMFLPYTCVDQFPFESYGALFPVNNGQVKIK